MHAEYINVRNFRECHLLRISPRKELEQFGLMRTPYAI